jgi:hypothetical protein
MEAKALASFHFLMILLAAMVMRLRINKANLICRTKRPIQYPPIIRVIVWSIAHAARHPPHIMTITLIIFHKVLPDFSALALSPYF